MSSNRYEMRQVYDFFTNKLRKDLTKLNLKSHTEQYTVTLPLQGFLLHTRKEIIYFFFDSIVAEVAV